MKRFLVLIVAMLVIAAPAYATLLVGDNFNSYSGAIGGQGGWTLSEPGGGAGPVAVDGAASWDMLGDPSSETALKHSFDAVSTGTLNAYFDIALDSAPATPGAIDQGTTMSMIKLFSSTGVEYARVRMYSGTDWTVGNPYNDINVVGAAGAGKSIGNPAMGAVTNIWMSVDLATKTATVSVKENNAWVAKQSNIALYSGFSGADIGRVDWLMFRYKDLKSYSYANATLDNMYIYHNELMPVPEPSSLVALGMFGLSALGMIKRRK